MKFLTGFGQRPQHLLGTVGLGSFLLGGRVVDLPRRVVGRLAARHLGLEPVHLHEKSRVIYSLGLLLLGGQLMSMGFLAELFVAYHAPRSPGVFDLRTHPNPPVMQQFPPNLVGAGVSPASDPRRREPAPQRITRRPAPALILAPPSAGASICC